MKISILKNKVNELENSDNFHFNKRKKLLKNKLDNVKNCSEKELHFLYDLWLEEYEVLNGDKKRLAQ